jgi:6-phosphofructokinase 1
MNAGQLGRYGKVRVDPHGHLRLGEIEFGRMIKDFLEERMQKLNMKTALITKDLGYELRCADPIPFDAEYTRDLGYGAVKFLRSEASARFGAIISFVEGRMVPLPFDEMINPETKRMKTRKVDVDGEGYECARRYMIRLDKDDFAYPERLQKLAAVVNLSQEEFRSRFSYVVANDP